MTNFTQQEACNLFGWAGFIVQILLGTIAFLVLVFKRNQQVPKRPWKIWILDTSKQGSSQLIGHFLNVWISSKAANSDPCVWYLMILILDCTLGVLISIAFLRSVQTVLRIMKLQRLQSGNYYQSTLTFSDYSKDHSILNKTDEYAMYFQITQPRRVITINYSMWFAQLMIWTIVVLFAKLIVCAVQSIFGGLLYGIGDFLIGWLRRWPVIQLTVVLFIIPVIMNSGAFWIQDNQLKKRRFLEL